MVLCRAFPIFEFDCEGFIQTLSTRALQLAYVCTDVVVQSIEEHSQAVIDAWKASLKEILEDPDGGAELAKLMQFVVNINELKTTPLTRTARQSRTD